jgi:hypothetical protein
MIMMIMDGCDRLFSLQSFLFPHIQSATSSGALRCPLVVFSSFFYVDTNLTRREERFFNNPFVSTLLHLRREQLAMIAQDRIRAGF